MTHDKLNILFVSVEVAPFAKVGGLADVAGALPKALAERGHDVRIAMPAFAMVEAGARSLAEPFPVQMTDSWTEMAYVRETTLRGRSSEVPVYLIGNHHPGDPARGFFKESVNSQSVYVPGAEPYLFFCRAVLETLHRLGPQWQPDVIHCNDWHTGLLPVFARQYGKYSGASVFTIHNLAYQGGFGRDTWPLTGLPDSLYNYQALEFYGNWSFMKGGLVAATRINTVSETYAREVCTPEYGCGLDGLMNTLTEHGKFTGIVNGIDYEEYDPARDPRVEAHFNAANPSGKRACKLALQAELRLPQRREEALIGVVSRLSDQKGFDLIRNAMERLVSMPVQLVVQGVGDTECAAYFLRMEKEHPDKVRARIVFDTDLAQRIYSGCDLFLMPSRFEPCGLGQLMALRYGTLPIVRATGGLADTVHNYDPVAYPDGNGFVFTDYRTDALVTSVERAVAAFRSNHWPDLVERALRCDHSWQAASIQYEALYRAAICAGPNG